MSAISTAAPVQPRTEVVANEAHGLGWLPALAVCAAGGVLIIVLGDGFSRATQSSAQALFWIGLAVLYVPVVFRLARPAPLREERLLLTLLLGLCLYLVKVMHDPFGFTYGDELAHVPNVNSILRTHELFHANSILPVTTYYPGLESLAAALSSLSGLSPFGAGLVVIGAARLVIVIALFLLFERLTGSSRVAGLAAATYMTNANFLFFSAQFSYESLALPLLVMILFAYTEWRSRELQPSWSVVILLSTCAVVVTHHMSSYALCALLIGVSLAYLIHAGDRQQGDPYWFAMFALLATAGWLIFVARATLGYLTPVITGAFASTIHTLSGEAAPRQLFAPTPGAAGAPLLERVTGIASVLLLAAAFLFGLRAAWRGHRDDPVVMVLTVAAAGFFGTLALRFAPAAWETANRASEFLFLGLALVVALSGLDRWSPARLPWLGGGLTAACLAIVFAGGTIAGWSPDLRLAQPYRINAGGKGIEPEGRQLASWVIRRLGPGRHFAASSSDARLLASYAQAIAIEGESPNVKDVLQTSTLPGWELALLRRNRLRYVVIDRRRSSFDNLAGYFFATKQQLATAGALYPSAVVDKFDRVRVSRIYDSGNVVVFDLGPRLAPLR